MCAVASASQTQVYQVSHAGCGVAYLTHMRFDRGHHAAALMCKQNPMNIFFAGASASRSSRLKCIRSRVEPWDIYILWGTLSGHRVDLFTGTRWLRKRRAQILVCWLFHWIRLLFWGRVCSLGGAPDRLACRSTAFSGVACPCGSNLCLCGFTWHFFFK